MKSIEILLVEDNPGDIKLTLDAFKDGRVANRINVVEDGEQALMYLRKQGEFIKAVRPDIILLDLNLPIKDGREVLHEIKTDKLLKKIPVVILTTSIAEQDILNAYDNYANCYIRKPVDLDKFIEVVHKVEDFWLTIVKLPTDSHLKINEENV
jgi:chemotaxis family two-component system response regulator Rcp1